MAEGRVQRRLAAILAADVAGYSRLMGEDEEGTLTALTAHLSEAVEPAIARHHGRVVKTTGDGLLAEFASVVDAVRCAVAIQETMRERSAATPENRRITFRIGINLGDVIVQEDDVYGDGVNVAARLEALAEPGNICVSSSVHEQVINKVEVRFEDLGPQQVKNIAQPVRAFRIRVDAPSGVAVTSQETVSTLGGKPSIAVLPFVNLSGDHEQESFADGMTDDMITDLSKISGLFVVASNTSFAYKGRRADIRGTARDLGVRYILEGSVRKAGDRVRINAQLIDAITGGHLWADRYDGALGDAFALQDEVSRQVVNALAIRLEQGEEVRLQQVHTRSVSAYELFVRAKSMPYPPVKERIVRARDAYRRVIEIDPDFAGGYAGVSAMLSWGAFFGHWDDPSAEIDRAVQFARKGIEVDDTFGWSYTALGFAHLARAEFDEAVAAAKEGERRQPGDADAQAYLGYCLIWVGRAREALEHINRAIPLNPHPNVPYYYWLLLAHFTLEEYDEAVTAFRTNVDRGGPTALPGNCIAAAAYAAAGRTSEAAELVRLVLEGQPDFTIGSWRCPYRWKDPESDARLLSALVKAGLPQ